MKAFKLLCLLLFIPFITFAQTPKTIETDLVSAFNRIDYWYGKQGDTTSDILAVSDSLAKANDIFGRKLQYYTSKYPFTISQKFSSFADIGLATIESADGQFRIYSWDTYMGGTMHDFANVIQYKAGQKTNSILDTASAENEKYIYAYADLYNMSANNHVYYLAVYYGVFSGKDKGKGIRIFSIENGKLVDAKLIKTNSGFHDKLYYAYNPLSVTNNIKDADIHYDATQKTISLPIITGEGYVTNNRIIYKFTGQYFERVKK
ncbi:hypothetical protein [Mucilaginibacter gotjawali]|uniref:Uncharacterized protein n=2 Tax=Mucilaginibacter gotjawali TaxID=1550579 RepID=A0A0X8X0C7_9SPHI|nr:hypothetical protein [Mucilaginibacter gotjawali]MBB3055393.1 hypothetical protein [Mucilaginibacter gotjawali]BAU53330.1 hypothetical protein MgSA37_01497 [Mucilaginibacter gotjawali]